MDSLAQVSLLKMCTHWGKHFQKANLNNKHIVPSLSKPYRNKRLLIWETYCYITTKNGLCKRHFQHYFISWALKMWEIPTEPVTDFTALHKHCSKTQWQRDTNVCYVCLFTLWERIMVEVKTLSSSCQRNCPYGWSKIDVFPAVILFKQVYYIPCILVWTTTQSIVPPHG